MSIIQGSVISSSRAEARKRGLSRYVGKPCASCGSTVRYTISNHCPKCERDKQRKRNGAHDTDIDPMKTKRRIDAKLEELALMRELDCLS